MTGDIGADTVTVLRAALVGSGRYGAQARDWPNAVAHVRTGVSVQPVGADEATVDREYAATHLRLFDPSDAPLYATDRIVWRGTTFELDGEPAYWYDDAGVFDHIEAALKRLAG